MAKVASAEKDYRGAVDQMERPAAPGAARSSGALLQEDTASRITMYIMARGPGTLTAPAALGTMPLQLEHEHRRMVCAP